MTRKRSNSFERTKCFDTPSGVVKIEHDIMTGRKKVFVNDLCIYHKRRKLIEVRVIALIHDT